MGDPPDDRAADDASASGAGGAPVTDAAKAPAAETDGDTDRDLEALRRRVEEEYDFDDFGPADMDRMSAEEWEAAFDPESWIVGEELLDRVERDLEARIASRDVFAALERVHEDGEPRLAAWADEGYAVVYPDGSVRGSGTVLRDVKASVALCSMESYEVADPPADYELPDPGEVPEGTGEFGNLMLQTVAAVQVLAGVGLGVAWLAGAVTTIVAPVAALAFLGIGLFLFALVANARLSDRFRAEEFRERLRTVEETGRERPEFLPPPVEEDGPDGSDVGPADGDDGTGEDDPAGGAVRR